MKKNLIILFVLVLAALAFIFIPQMDSTPAQPADDIATPLSATEMPAQPTQADSSPSVVDSLLWTEHRNERFGFGIAVPCWWEVTPMPAEGFIASMTLRSYDEAFFLANSEKGVWFGGVAPEGAVSIDITAATNIDANLSLTKAYLQLIDTNTYTINNVVERSVGSNPFTIFVLQNLINPTEAGNIVYATRLAPNAMLVFSTTPAQAIQSIDVQAILSSYAAVAEEPITFPRIQPSKPLMNKSCEL
jgi:hypothetical protein